MKDGVIPTAPPIYTTLPTEGDGHAYRLQQITRIQTELMREAEKRASLSKKYTRVLNSVDGTDAALATVGAGQGIGGVFLISTAVALPIAVGLEIGSLGCTGLSVIGKVAGRRLSNKLVKHRRKALADGNISDVEYRLVLDELQKFEDLKREVRAENAEEHGGASKKKILKEIPKR